MLFERTFFSLTEILLLQVKREFRVLSALHSISFPVPKPYLYCEDASVIGTEFYIMDHVKVSLCLSLHIFPLKVFFDILTRLWRFKPLL